MALSRRFVILHHHIFKNAGSTIEWALHKNFQGGFVTFDYSTAKSVIHEHEVRTLLDDNPEIRAISSHQFHTKRFHLENYVALEIIILRNPLDRLCSIYSHYRRMIHGDIGHEFSRRAKALPLAEFLHFLTEEHPDQVQNVQANLLFNHGLAGMPPGEGDLAKVADRILKIAVPGVVDLFDESMVCAQYYLGPYFQGLDLSYQSQNVDPEKPGFASESARRMKMLCGDKLYDQLVLMNELDFRLLDMVKGEIKRRADLVPRFSERLSRFKERCRDWSNKVTAKVYFRSYPERSAGGIW